MKDKKMYNGFKRAGFSDAVISGIFERFKNTSSVRHFIGSDNAVYMLVAGEKKDGTRGEFYYDFVGGEFIDNPMYRHVSHVVYNPKDALYNLVHCARTLPDMDPQHRVFDIYESQFTRAGTLYAFNPDTQKQEKLCEMGKEPIKFRAQHEIADRMFLEFGIGAGRNIMVESNGRPLTRIPGKRFRVMPKQGVIVQEIVDANALRRYNVFDVRSRENPCLLENLTNLSVESDTGLVIYSPKVSPYFGNVATIEKLRAHHMMRSK